MYRYRRIFPFTDSTIAIRLIGIAANRIAYSNCKNLVNGGIRIGVVPVSRETDYTGEIVSSLNDDVLR